MSRVRPNFFLAGAAKSGTTSLYTWLGQHPEVALAEPKEPHFFVEPRPHACLRVLARRIADRSRYLALFSESRVVGEGSTLYLWAPESPELIARECPDARFIFSLRDPVERAFSSYLNSLREGTERRSFAAAVDEESSMAAVDRDELRRPLHLDPGFYSRGLGRFFERFGRERVLVLLFDELVARSRECLRGSFDFLGIDTSHTGSIPIEAQNRYRRPRSRVAAEILGSGELRSVGRRLLPLRARRAIYNLLVREDRKPEMDGATRDRLIDLYRPEARVCEELLQRELPWPWIRESRSASADHVVFR